MPICDGCEQKVPYQDLDTHQRYCRGSQNDDDPTTAERLDARKAVFEECLELAKRRLAERLDERGRARQLPDDPAGIEGSNLRYTRPPSRR
ncbi:hypothetical protein G9C85_13775 [Halorubellus sp. JP-L1]|uniref:hypothetical protein n=1 Tax=Halorubellus sp. JP-L1 TaxID=2715753 RepID=UPI00140DAFE1|nr:hypothetical protein [Halorubellus sp. JP-L1]NHN42690.1 hypothetical protein [Halorubellus sp. JP-L1]